MPLLYILNYINCAELVTVFKITKDKQFIIGSSCKRERGEWGSRAAMATSARARPDRVRVRSLGPLSGRSQFAVGPGVTGYGTWRCRRRVPAAVRGRGAARGAAAVPRGGAHVRGALPQPGAAAPARAPAPDVRAPDGAGPPLRAAGPQGDGRAARPGGGAAPQRGPGRGVAAPAAARRRRGHAAAGHRVTST